MRFFASLLHVVLALVLAPLLPGVINRTKAFFGGRRGQPLFQVYRDVFKLLRKGAVYSTTSTGIFRLGPALGLGVTALVLMLVPAGPVQAPLAFRGDFVFLAYALGLMRFATVLAALDTGSSFEGMGASREVQFSLLAEAAFFSALAALVAGTGRFSLSGMLAALWTPAMHREGTWALLVGAAFLIVLLAENARSPVDDPTTHLELTMIHEVMVLDHGGIDLAFIQYGAALKLWIFAAILTGVAIPIRTGSPLSDLGITVAGILAVAVLVGVLESTMARLRLLRVPQLLVVALALALASFFWTVR
jgi:formate hydrogenlyase subunit 4